MLNICRAEDGEVFQVNTTLWEIERGGSLEDFLQEETGVDRDAILAYLSDGRRLRNDNIRELAGAQDETIFVFNKYYLDDDLDEVLRELRVEPALQPIIEDTMPSTPPFRPSQLSAAYLHTAHAHHDHITRTLSTLQHQHTALRIAARSLDLNLLSLADAFDVFAGGASRELSRQSGLLEGLETDLAVVVRVRVHPEFLSPAVRRMVEAGEKARTLGDYVSNVKMRQVAEGCAKSHKDLQVRFDLARESVTRLKEGADQVRAALSNTRLVENAESCQRRSQDLVERITDAAAVLESPVSNSDGLLQDLHQFDAALRKEVENITDIKNASTELIINTLRRISTLNVDLVRLPNTMSSLQADFRVKTSFGHIHRLHNMLYAYGATLVEIVRRKEFARFFYQRAQNILEVMAKLSASERKRRQIYRGEVHGQLPFEAKGMDDQVPIIDFSPSGKLDGEYSLERSDIDAFLNTLDSIEKHIEAPTSMTVHPIREIRVALDKLISRIDNLESTFDRIVERSVLSASRLSQSRRRLTEAEEAAIHELSEQLNAVQQAKDDQEVVFANERDELHAEISRQKAELAESTSEAQVQRDRADGLERDLHVVRAQLDGDATARRVMEQRHQEQTRDVETMRQNLARALSDATDQAKIAEQLRQELVQSRAESEAVKTLEANNSEKIAQLLEDQAVTLRNLEEARMRGEDLQGQIQAARTESDDVNRALKDASEQKDRLLRVQAMEHDRIMRDHIAEADGDRAVLEHQFFEVKATLDDSERQLKECRAEIEVLHADASGLREELQRAEHELREARHIERVLRGDLSAGMASQSDFERKLQDRDRMVAQLLNVAIAFRDSHSKALRAVQAMVVHPGSASKSNPNLADSIVSSGVRPMTFSPTDERNEPAPIDASDPEGALEALRSFDHDIFFENVSKVGSVIRKWQKQCKEYRERAKGKISFRNFAKGDLALFLPTRNSVSKPWAAFNVSFPHYFLQATGSLAEQLKTREWIVARITSLTERIADHRDPGSNPYGLGDGVKYYMLEVEDWTQPGNAVKRRTNSAKKVPERTSSPPPPERPISPPPAEPPQPSTSPESLGATRSPNSHLFPVRTRANSATAGPSSLSRLLAQASPVESPLETIPSSPTRTRTPSPTAAISPPPPSPTRPLNHNYSPNNPSPLRPGSRASSSSRFSLTGRIPPFPGSASSGSSGIPKAAATTALSSDAPVPSPPSSSISSASKASPTAKISQERSRASTPSPTLSATEGMSSVLTSRRRTTSEHIPVTGNTSLSAKPSVGTSATSALANLANSWGAAIGRRTRRESTSGNVSGHTSDSGDRIAQRLPPTPASEMLKRF
ncbi:putative peripheral membrane protein [Rickenella mellea]|uniref:Autophagy-related protein 11 n=1 Tax=Rickenella mellea TaxID=50990 RepID=A0A4Y7QD61_9AGAM|nr:putative peripheral membrane protein [Rickenella mellea]